MGKKNYVVESEFDDLHGNPDDTDLELDLSDADNPIITAAISDAEDDDNWKPPKKDDKDDDDGGDDDGEEDLDDDDADDLVELDQDDDDGEDDDGDDDGSDDDDEDEDDEKYSKKVRARIDRERNLRLQDKQESDQRMRKLERKIELRDARDTFNTDQAKADKELRSLKAKKVKAVEEEDAVAQVEIDDKILDIKADRKAKALALDAEEKDIDDDTADAQSSNATPEVGRKFLAKYPEFHSNPEFRNVLLLADKQVAARKFDRNTEEYYAEIENILRPQFPKIIKKRPTKVTAKRGKKKGKRSAVGDTTKAGTRRKSSQRRRGRIRLTRSDQEQMEVFGLDPTNASDAKAWADGKGN